MERPVRGKSWGLPCGLTSPSLFWHSCCWEGSFLLLVAGVLDLKRICQISAWFPADDSWWLSLRARSAPPPPHLPLCLCQPLSHLGLRSSPTSSRVREATAPSCPSSHRGISPFWEVASLLLFVSLILLKGCLTRGQPWPLGTLFSSDKSAVWVGTWVRLGRSGGDAWWCRLSRTP